ncbi:MAG: bifunctional phosphopantothenoylcysteine decarboxylase/phosphopantothenate--cysteine ligase CoaBC [Balneolales bacterium]|nr:bifunctional phosphopantothenoylcysteine decarboxylase/phosphopantothenate--cysteine ligase CoaBC [Balneolales bacterium]
MTGNRIILGVSGGIAAYKSVYLVRELQKAGAEVRVVMTPSATRFVGSETFVALTRSSVPIHVFNENDADVSDSWSKHIHWAEWADIMIVAPCTANTLAGLVHGLSDNMLLTTALAIRCPLLICPTMDGGMYRSPAVSRNLKLAGELGFHILEPDHGYLASGIVDEGRLPETSDIIQAISNLLEPESDQILKGKRVMVSAGPTREYIDAVRFISNPSSGKMGVALAEAARSMGAEVTLFHGKLAVALPTGVKHVAFTSAQDLFDAVSARSDEFDILIMAAAVSDFTPIEKSDKKIKKSVADTNISLKPTPDTLKWLGEHKHDGQLLIGFAMETENLEAEVDRKRREKNADWIAGNLLNAPDSGFEGDENTILLKSADEAHLLKGTKREVARQILEISSQY